MQKFARMIHTVIGAVFFTLTSLELALLMSTVARETTVKAMGK